MIRTLLGSSLLLGFLVFFLSSNNLNLLPKNQTKSYGHIISSKGTVMGRPIDGKYFTNLKDNSPLSKSHRVLTGSNSTTTILFGEQFTLSQNGSIDLLKVANKFQIHLLSGEILRTKPQINVSFYINQKPIKDLTITVQKNNSLVQMGDHSKNKPSHTEDARTQKLLRETFKLHQRFIEKCFIKHYERSLGKTHSGRIMMSFKVNSKERLEEISIKESQFKDPIFHDCLKEVVSRVRLKKYSSHSKIIDFPIQVSLPQ